MVMRADKISERNENIVRCECDKFLSTYAYWVTWALIVALFILFFVLLYSDYRQNAVIEFIWNATIKSDAGVLNICP